MFTYIHIYICIYIYIYKYIYIHVYIAVTTSDVTSTITNQISTSMYTSKNTFRHTARSSSVSLCNNNIYFPIFVRSSHDRKFQFDFVGTLLSNLAPLYHDSMYRDSNLTSCIVNF